MARQEGAEASRRLERRTLLINLVREWPEFFVRKAQAIASCVGTHIAVIALGIVAVGNRGNRRLSCVGQQFSDTVAFAWPA